MNIDFRQGIINYPATGPLAVNQQFLTYAGGNVSLQTNSGATNIAFAHGTEDYLYSESSTVTNAWTGLPTNVNVWLYWDINLRTAVRTFGFTLLQPIVSPIAPPSPVQDQHWFNTSTTTMMWYNLGGWITVVRVFAARINNSTFYPLGTNPNSPFAGTQVGIISPNIQAGRIIVDNVGMPIRRTNGLFFTTEDDFFVQGSPVNVVKLEASVFDGTALEPMGSYQVAYFSEFGQLNLASYANTQNDVIAVCMQDILTGQTGTICVQGYITNPEWNWSTVGAPLWISDTQPGILIETNPHITDPVDNLIDYLPVATVVTPTSVIFTQGISQAASQGSLTSTGVSSFNTRTGSVLLTPSDINAALGFTPYSAANPAGYITSVNVPVVSFNTRTGAIVLTSSDITTALTYTPVNKAGDTMTGQLTLSANPLTALEAATKSYVDSIASGLIWTNPIFAVDVINDVLATPPVTPVLGQTYIVGVGGTGAWVGKDGHAMTWNGSSWNDELNRAITVGDRFGINLAYGGNPLGGLIGRSAFIAQVAGGSVGLYFYSFAAPTLYEAVFVNNQNSLNFGAGYTYTATGWIEFSGASSISNGPGLTLTSNVLSLTPVGIAGTYTSVTTNAYGQVTVGSNPTPPLAVNSLQLGGISSVNYAQLNGPTFTGVPKAPTATLHDNSTQIATTAFVTAAVGAVAGATITRVTTTTTSVGQQIIASLPTNTYRSASFIIQGVDTVDFKFHTTNIIAVHNAPGGLTADFTEYGSVDVGGQVATYAVAVDITGANLQLLATPASANATIFQVAIIPTPI